MVWYYYFTVAKLDESRPADKWNPNGFYKHLFTTEKVDTLGKATDQHLALARAFQAPKFKITTCRTPNHIQSIEGSPLQFRDEG